MKIYIWLPAGYISRHDRLRKAGLDRRTAGKVLVWSSAYQYFIFGEYYGRSGYEGYNALDLFPRLGSLK